MFSKAIRDHVHPGTWAIIGIKTGVNRIQHGTGFAVDDSGHILTCYHCTFLDEQFTQPCDLFTLVQPEINLAVRLSASVVAKEKDRDLALLKIDDPKIKTKPLTLIERDTVPYGTSCAAFGHPLPVADPKTSSIRIFTRSASGALSMPFEAGRFDQCRAIKLYELDFFTHGGMSGGPVFLRNGHVFGVVSGSQVLDDGTGKGARSNLSIVIDSREAIEFLKALHINPKTKRHVGS